MNFTDYLSHQYSTPVWPSTAQLAPSPIYTPPASVSSPSLFSDELDDMYSFSQNVNSGPPGYPSPLFSPLNTLESDDNVPQPISYQAEAPQSLLYPLPVNDKGYTQPCLYHSASMMPSMTHLTYQFTGPMEPPAPQSEIFFDPNYHTESLHQFAETNVAPIEEKKAPVPPTKTTSKRKSLTCQYEGCHKTFTRHYNLVSHMRTHTSERPFVCPDPSCGKAFARPHDRNRHAKLHLGIKPHVCTNCRKRFARADALSRHLKVKNGCSQRYD
ncbi:DNA-binding transcription factor [Umbelopsis sp. WA50703]